MSETKTDNPAAPQAPSIQPVLDAYRASAETVATSDSVILDRCDRWLNLAREVVAAHVPQAWIVDLSGS